MSLFEKKEGQNTLSIEKVLSIQLTDYLRTKATTTEAPEYRASYVNSRNIDFPYITYSVGTTRLGDALEVGKIMIDDVLTSHTPKNVVVMRQAPTISTYDLKGSRNQRWTISMRLAIVPIEEWNEDIVDRK